MKRLLLLSMIIISCGSTENEIKSAAMSIEEKRLISSDGSVDNIDIDSLEYLSVSLQDYYSNKQLVMMQTWHDIIKIRLSGMTQTIDSLNAENQRHRVIEREIDSLYRVPIQPKIFMK